jgi:hypothetical protein
MNEDNARKHDERHQAEEAPTDTTTGPGEGVSAMGVVPAGGGMMAGENEGVPRDRNLIGRRDTDTGMVFGQGQSTSTGTLPTQGGPNLDGTGTAGVVDVESDSIPEESEDEDDDFT